MSSPLLKIASISDLREKLGLSKATHPLITIIDPAKLSIGKEHIGQKFTSELYCIALKDASCGLDYGRNTYDFNEGVLIFTAPHQVLSINKSQSPGEVNGWMLYFHPDLIRNTHLGTIIDDYTFFSYDVHEALHLSELEQDTITRCVDMIKIEIEARIDNHSNQVLCSNIELLLNYSQRYYQRQFNTRRATSSDFVTKVEWLLKEYYETDQLIKKGPPSIQYLADQCHLSANYLSDLLSKETGRSAKDHINDFLIDKAKTLLLSSNDSVSGIAYTLGFNYPHYFGRLFKQKTGMTPVEYRQVN